MKNLTYVCMFSLVCLGLGHARTWTSSDGREIEADLVRVDDGVVVLSMKGKEYRVPMDKLSEEDQEFVASQEGAEDEPAAAGEAGEAGTLFGVALKPGETINASGPLDDKVARALSGNKLEPKEMKIRLRLSEDFDPNKPQKVFWVVGGINNEAERLSGNIGTFDGRSRTPASKGWVVISADTEHGNPRESTVALCEGDKEFHFQVIDEMTKVWPDFKSWKHACGGHSSGAKGSFFRIAQLLKADVNVVGGFFGGCNQSMAKMAGEETGVRKSGFRKVKAFQCTGDKDNLVDAGQIEKVADEMKDAGIRQIRSKTFPGGHTITQELFAEALDWFLEDE